MSSAWTLSFGWSMAMRIQRPSEVQLNPADEGQLTREGAEVDETKVDIFSWGQPFAQVFSFLRFFESLSYRQLGHSDLSGVNGRFIWARRGRRGVLFVFHGQKTTLKLLAKLSQEEMILKMHNHHNNINNSYTKERSTTLHLCIFKNRKNQCFCLKILNYWPHGFLLEKTKWRQITREYQRWADYFVRHGRSEGDPVTPRAVAQTAKAWGNGGHLEDSTGRTF